MINKPITDQAHWENEVHDRLTGVMVISLSVLSGTALISATLRALLTALMADDDAELRDIKQRIASIAKSLSRFH